MPENPKVADIRERHARPRPKWSDVLVDAFNGEERLAEHVRAKRVERQDRSNELANSPAYSWLVGELERARSLAAKAEAAAWAAGNTHAAAHNAGARENCEGVLRLIQSHGRSTK
jgi:hypothetical protein